MLGDTVHETSEKLLRDRYQIKRQLGRNGGRETFLALDLTTNASVVIKLLTFDHDIEWDDLRLFEREAETLRSLSHPNIPKYLDFFEIDTPHEKQLALVQSYVEGRSLQDYINSGRTFTETDIQQLSRSLLNILIYLHGRQPPVIHRDIKPSNILLSDRSGNSIGEVYLVDFGSVQTLVSQEGQTVTVVGTYGYMPPEQFGGRAVPASDLYGVGATAIALATGKHPAELPKNDLRIQFQPFAELSPELVHWLRQMTEPNLKYRFDSAQTALNALDNCSITSLEAGLIQAKPIASHKIWFHAVILGGLRYSLLGMLLGIVVENASFPILGLFATFLAVPCGATAGLALGLVNGLFLAILTNVGFSPLKQIQQYQTITALSSAFIGVVGGVLSLCVMAHYNYLALGVFLNVIGYRGWDSQWSNPGYVWLALCVAIAGGLGTRYIGRIFTQWYIQESLNKTKRQALVGDRQQQPTKNITSSPSIKKS